MVGGMIFAFVSLVMCLDGHRWLHNLIVITIMLMLIVIVFIFFAYLAGLSLIHI